MGFVENFFSWKTLRSEFLRYTDLQSAVFPLPPQLFQVKGQSEQKQFGSYIGPAASQEASESEIMVSRFNEASLPHGIQVQIVIQTFIYGVGCDFLIPGPGEIVPSAAA